MATISEHVKKQQKEMQTIPQTDAVQETLRLFRDLLQHIPKYKRNTGKTQPTRDTMITHLS